MLLNISCIGRHVMSQYFCFCLTIFFIRFGSKFYRQIVGIPMGTNCAPLVADLFLFCYERDFMKYLSNDNQPTLLRHSTQRLDI